MAKNEKNKKSVFSTLGRWIKRLFFGGSKELSNMQYSELIESPTEIVVKSFFRRPLAVGALIFLICMFAFVFIGPKFVVMDLGYEESYHANISPGYEFLNIPSDLAKDVKDISSFSFYSVGLDNNGKVYMWGKTKKPNSPEHIDLADIPQEVLDEKIAFISAGYDHVIAIAESGKVYGWGEYENGQYGDKGSLVGTSLVKAMPKVLMTGKIDVKNVKQLVCGYQVTAIVMKDGSGYLWGNVTSGASNIKKLNNLFAENLVDRVEFLGSNGVAILKDGTVYTGEAGNSFELIEIKKANGTSEFIEVNEYINGRKIKDICTTKSAIAFLLEDNELLIDGIFDTTSNYAVTLPELENGEHISEIAGGAKHITVLTNKGHVYSIGNNFLGQCNVNSTKDYSNSKLYVGAFQNYIVGSDNKLITKYGCKGYLFGTDELGRDVFTRIVHGGKMTMTIGTVAVIISTVIAIIVGCISGYFGGAVDLILMRITEIFSAIPFLPFALILSAVLAGSNLTEDTRIFMIMVILGLLSWTGLAHMIRGQVLAEREKEFVIAAQSMGVKESRIAFKHILPNVISIILVSVTLDFAGCMLTESSLSYLGFGVKLPRPTWGNMLNGCNNEVVISEFWWRWLFPSLFLLFTTISINIIGDTLRDVLDPKSSSDR